MGKRIDLIVFWLLIIVATFMLFLAATKNIPAAMALSGAFALLLHNVTEHLGARRKGTKIKRQYAAYEVNRWVTADYAEASWLAAEHLCREFHLPEPTLRQGEIYTQSSEETVRLVLIQRHPSGSALDVNEILSLHRDAKDSGVLLLMTTGGMGAKAEAFSKELTCPIVRVFSANEMAGWVRAQTTEVPEYERKREKRSARSVFVAIIEGVKPVRTGLYGLLLLTIYLIFGSLLYLPVALVLLLLAGLKLKKPRAKRSLFD